MNKSLIACSILFALSQTKIDEDLNEIKLAVVGKWKGHPSGPFELTYEDLLQIKANFDNGEVDIVVDFEHASLWNEKAPATGWIKELFFKEKDLWAKVKWIGDSKELINSEHYKYISPVFDSKTIDQISGDDIGWSLHSVALTNRPFLEELGEVKALKANASEALNAESQIANNKNQKGDTSMTNKEKKELEDLKEENQKLKDAADTAEEKRVEEEVDTAIANSKATPEQKDSLLAFGKSNPEGLTKLLEAASTTIVAPESNLYKNSKQTHPQTNNNNTLSDEELKA